MSETITTKAVLLARTNDIPELEKAIEIIQAKQPDKEQSKEASPYLQVWQVIECFMMQPWLYVESDLTAITSAACTQYQKQTGGIRNAMYTRQVSKRTMALMFNFLRDNNLPIPTRHMHRPVDWLNHLRIHYSLKRSKKAMLETESRLIAITEYEIVVDERAYVVRKTDGRDPFIRYQRRDYSIADFVSVMGITDSSILQALEDTFSHYLVSNTRGASVNTQPNQTSQDLESTFALMTSAKKAGVREWYQATGQEMPEYMQPRSRTKQ